MLKNINLNLLNPPKYLHEDYSSFKYLIFDGTFLNRTESIVTLMNTEDQQIIAGAYGVRETSNSELYDFFINLKHRGLNPLSLTVDGLKAVGVVIKAIWPDVTIQRCLVHIQRQGLQWCRVNPKRSDAKYLRKIFLMVANIRDSKDRNIFLGELRNWEEKYGLHIGKAKETGWVFSDIKRARSMLLKAIPYMFHYLNDPRIPKTTNSLEGYFSRLKSKYRNHRGLSKLKRYNYFQWFFDLKRK